MTACPHCGRCTDPALIVDAETVRDVYEAWLIDLETDEQTEPVVVLEIRANGAALSSKPARESRRTTP